MEYGLEYGVDVLQLSFPVNAGLPISKAEIDRHMSRESCYLVAQGRVYDVTEWLAHHPAGAACILKHAGSEHDCSEDLNFHSPQAQALWAKYQIGTVEGYTQSCTIL